MPSQRSNELLPPYQRQWRLQEQRSRRQWLVAALRRWKRWQSRDPSSLYLLLDCVAAMFL